MRSCFDLRHADPIFSDRPEDDYDGDTLPPRRTSRLVVDQNVNVPRETSLSPIVPRSTSLEDSCRRLSGAASGPSPASAGSNPSPNAPSSVYVVTRIATPEVGSDVVFAGSDESTLRARKEAQEGKPEEDVRPSSVVVPPRMYPPQPVVKQLPPPIVVIPDTMERLEASFSPSRSPDIPERTLSRKPNDEPNGIILNAPSIRDPNMQSPVPMSAPNTAKATNASRQASPRNSGSDNSFPNTTLRSTTSMAAENKPLEVVLEENMATAGIDPVQEAEAARLLAAMERLRHMEGSDNVAHDGATSPLRVRAHPLPVMAEKAPPVLIPVPPPLPVAVSPVPSLQEAASVASTLPRSDMSKVPLPKKVVKKSLPGSQQPARPFQPTSPPPATNFAPRTPTPSGSQQFTRSSTPGTSQASPSMSAGSPASRIPVGNRSMANSGATSTPATGASRPAGNSPSRTVAAPPSTKSAPSQSPKQTLSGPSRSFAASNKAVLPGKVVGKSKLPVKAPKTSNTATPTSQPPKAGQKATLAAGSLPAKAPQVVAPQIVAPKISVAQVKATAPTKAATQTSSAAATTEKRPTDSRRSPSGLSDSSSGFNSSDVIETLSQDTVGDGAAPAGAWIKSGKAQDRSELSRAVRSGSQQEVRALISNKMADWSTALSSRDNEDGLSPLIHAGMAGDVAMVRLLLESCLALPRHPLFSNLVPMVADAVAQLADKRPPDVAGEEIRLKGLQADLAGLLAKVGSLSAMPKEAAKLARRRILDARGAYIRELQAFSDDLADFIALRHRFSNEMAATLGVIDTEVASLAGRGLRMPAVGDDETSKAVRLFQERSTQLEKEWAAARDETMSLVGPHLKDADREAVRDLIERARETFMGMAWERVRVFQEKQAKQDGGAGEIIVAAERLRRTVEMACEWSAEDLDRWEAILIEWETNLTDVCEKQQALLEQLTVEAEERIQVVRAQLRDGKSRLEAARMAGDEAEQERLRRKLAELHDEWQDSSTALGEYRKAMDNVERLRGDIGANDSASQVAARRDEDFTKGYAKTYEPLQDLSLSHIKDEYAERVANHLKMLGGFGSGANTGSAPSPTPKSATTNGGQLSYQAVTSANASQKPQPHGPAQVAADDVDFRRQMRPIDQALFKDF